MIHPVSQEIRLKSFQCDFNYSCGHFKWKKNILTGFENSSGRNLEFFDKYICVLMKYKIYRITLENVSTRSHN